LGLKGKVGCLFLFLSIGLTTSCTSDEASLEDAMDRFVAAQVELNSAYCDCVASVDVFEKSAGCLQRIEEKAEPPVPSKSCLISSGKSDSEAGVGFGTCSAEAYEELVPCWRECAPSPAEVELKECESAADLSPCIDALPAEMQTSFEACF
jgi:hypothetical protein